jgi:hypothetical protein
MAKLIWDAPGERLYSAGLDRGVLYLTDNSGVPWNGLVSVDEDLKDEKVDPVYIDGVKYLGIPAQGDYEAKLSALTYPDEFLEYDGWGDFGEGLFVDNQPVKRFGLSYRTKIGNDLEEIDHGYKIHLVYNLLAIPESHTHKTLSIQPSPTLFSWKLRATPVELSGYAPTAHYTFDSTILNPYLIAEIEAILYGNDVDDARLPTIQELSTLIVDWDLITITDNGDGTWTAEGPDDLITMTGPHSFQIDQVDAIYLDEDTYEVSTTE